IEFTWSNEGPFVEEMNMDLRERTTNFRVRWSGYITPSYTETYTFATLSDDGIRVWIDDRLVIDNWTGHAPRFDYGRIQLVEGRPYTIMVEYFQGGGGAVLELYWQSDSQVYELVPEAALRPAPANNFPTTVHLLSLNSWSIEGNNAGAQVTVYRRGVFNERTAVPVYIEQQASGPPLRYNNLRTSGDHYEVVLAPGESTTSFSIVGIEDTRNTGPSELLLRLGEVPGYATTSSNPTRLVISDNEMELADDVFSLSGTVLATSAQEQFWTIAAFAESGDEGAMPVSYSVLPGSGSFILENLKAGTYVIRCWFDENQDFLPNDDELQLYNEVGQVNSLRQVPPADVSLLFTDMHVETEESEGDVEESVDPSMPDEEGEETADAQPMATESDSGGCIQNADVHGTSGLGLVSLLLLLCFYRRERCR
ncbi:MAG: PA14 domain-containing protein, partial [Bradymonadia bacterium]